MKTSTTLVMSAKASFLIAVFLPQEWDEYVRRPHWLAIANLATVLAIEPPVGILTALLHPERLMSYVQGGMRIRKGEENILFYRPMSLVSYGVGYWLPWLACVDHLLLSVQLQHVIRSLRSQFNHLISFVVKNQQYYVVDILPATLRCYEVTDEYRVRPDQDELDHNHFLTRQAEQAERRILSQVDIVFASSQGLYESRCRLNPDIYYIPNCADYSHFSKAINPDLEIPPDLRAISSPRIGYLGNINELIDIDLINALAKAREDWSIVLIGRENGSRDFMQSSAYQESKSRANIHYLGFRDYSLLPAYLKGFDVCLLPFRSCEWMKNSFPNKIYQYLSTGKPVVSTNFPAVSNAKDIIYIAHDRIDFLQLVERALAENNQGLMEIRMSFARGNSTHVRAQKKLDILSKALTQRERT